MRTLTATLLAEQKKSSVTPFVRIHLKSADGLTEYVFTTADSNSRVFSVIHNEEPYGGIAVIALKNTDQFFNTKNLRGYRVKIGWGFITTASPPEEYSEPAELYVISQRDRSEPGELLTELVCVDVWGLLARDGVFTGGTRLKGNPVVKTPVRAKRLTGQTSGAYGTIFDIGDTFIHLVGVVGTFQVGETASTADNNVSIVIEAIETVGAGELAPAYDGTTTVFNILEDMLSPFVTLTLDSDDPDSNAQTYKPEYITTIGTNRRAVIIDVLGFTQCGIRIRTDGAHLLYLDPSPTVADYEYDTEHAFLSERRDQGIVVPNRIYVVNREPGEGREAVSGYAEDTDSYNALGQWLSRIVVMSTVQTTTDANKRAAQLIARAKADVNTGIITVPIMNVGQEVYDWVKLTDAGSGNLVVQGRVGAVRRTYRDTTYQLEIRLGGLFTSAEITREGIPASNITVEPGLAEDFVPTPPKHWIVPQAIQGFEHDIDFSAVDWDTVQWSAGTIKFYDGTTQAISASVAPHYTIPTNVVHYIYFDLDDASPDVLKVTDNYQTVMTQRTGVVCIIQRASNTADKATIIPSRGKMPLITPDIILMSGLLNYDFGTDEKIRAILGTQISAGRLKLTADTIKDGEWYNEGGVIIDALKGITLLGKKVSFKDDTGTHLRGYIYGGAGAEFILEASGAGNRLFLMSEDDIVLAPVITGKITEVQKMAMTPTDVEANRAFNTTYTNGDAYPILVVVSATLPNLKTMACYIHATADPPTTLVSYNTNANANDISLSASFIVPVGWKYRVDCDGILDTWIETAIGYKI